MESKIKQSKSQETAKKTAYADAVKSAYADKEACRKAVREANLDYRRAKAHLDTVLAGGAK